MKKENWIWLPHPAHFICAQDCKFHLATYVGKYIVSTIGEYVPDGPVRESLAESRGIILEGIGDYRRADYMKKIGFEKLGAGRTYETMVFKAMKSPVVGGCKGCAWVIENGSNIDSRGYNNPNDAAKGHLELCKKWSKK